MPFTAPWHNYQTGDLFYGLGANRSNLMDALSATLDASRNLGWIDLFTLKMPDKVPRNLETATQGKKDRWLSFINTLQAYKDYEGILLPGTGTHRQNFVWKRKSKGGLYWATKVAHVHVHFCLDGLDMDMVVDKTFQSAKTPQRDDPQGPAPDDMLPEDKMRSITGAELRWVYRHRTDADVQSFIQFWDKNKARTFVQVGPPWEGAGAKTWSRYVPKSEKLAETFDETTL